MRDGSAIRHQMKKLQSKLDLYWKKFKSFGLTIEEAGIYNEAKIKFSVLHDELRDVEFDRVLMTYLYTKDVILALKKIQSIIPWEGGFVLQDKEFESILEADLDLSEDDRKTIADNLKMIHLSVIKNFEEFAAREEMESFLIDLAVFISGRKDAKVLDVLRYIDDRYREFGEILRIELPEIEVEWMD